MSDVQTVWGRYSTLRDLMQTLVDLEQRLEEVDDYIDHADVLRECADVLQRMREHYWPLCTQALEAWLDHEHG